MIHFTDALLTLLIAALVLACVAGWFAGQRREDARLLCEARGGFTVVGIGGRLGCVREIP